MSLLTKIDNFLDSFLFKVISFGFIWFFGFVVGVSVDRQAMQEACVKRKVAEYRVDNKGNVTFHFLTNGEQSCVDIGKLFLFLWQLYFWERRPIFMGIAMLREISKCAHVLNASVVANNGL